MKIIFLMFLVIILICFGCSEEDNPTEPTKKYSGITRTGLDNSTPIGEIDTNDWYFNKGEQWVEVFPAFPNPTKRYSYIHFTLKKQTYLKIWIDDPIAQKDTLIRNGIFHAGSYMGHLDFFYGDDNFIRKDGIVRVFFSFDSLPNIPLIYGDIQIEK